MRPLFSRLFTLGCILSLLSIIDVSAEHLIILHTNDTHSQLDPQPDGKGGILRRKVLIDSIRSAEKNVILVDAGDVVQGSLYFSIYKGRVEREMMNALGYELAILGNHEFDNGMDTLAREWKQLNAQLISTNYDLESTPLAGMFEPYTIKEYGNKKIGFIGINLNPDGMISPATCNGVIYSDAVTSANETAALLRDSLGADYVVALTHIGYNSKSPGNPSDSILAMQSRGIDIIIGGHSHTVLDEDSTATPIRFTNADGKEILVAQTGSLGVNLGKIGLDLNTGEAKSYLLPVDCRYDSRIDSTLNNRLTVYRNGIISQVNEILATTPCDIEKKSPLHCNLIGDIVKKIGEELNDSTPLDLAIVNSGGLRNGLLKGPITVGMIMTMLPFDNRLVLLDISGQDLIDSFRIMLNRGGDAISSGFDYTTINPDKTYRIVTIDYLAKGGDYMQPLTNATVVKTDIRRFDNAVIEWMRQLNGSELNLPSHESRFDKKL
ncbi:MAG: bifunctional metallophosphatase/5'-nucleotidase [Muribaculum sp.]|nr:bifunctional metallophosphatase/5'-nucleotidase [Muribaculum sp.]